MNTRLVRCSWSLLLAIGLFFYSLFPDNGIPPVQASIGAPQWLEYDSIVGSVVNSEFAAVLAQSADNTTAVIGARNETVNNVTGRGAAYGYRRLGNNSALLKPLQASDGAANDHFGTSVAISADGNTILVGAAQADVAGKINQGAAYVFTWNGTTWTQQAKLTALYGAASEFFGVSAALSADGNTALIGANGYAYNKSFQGGAYVFTRSGSTWSQQTVNTPLIAFDAADNDLMGGAAALSGDGNLALVSAPGKNNGQGAAYVYSRSGSSWSFQRKLWAWDGAAGDDFGRAVSLASDGSTALISADNAPIGVNTSQGAAYTFKRSGTSWSNGTKLYDPSGAALDLFGYSASLSADGSVALVGAPYRSTPALDSIAKQQGAAFVFYGQDFSHQQILVPVNIKDGYRVGAAAAAGGDGSYLMLGAPGLTWANNNWGMVYTFTRYTANWAEVFRLNNANGVKNDWLGNGLAISADGSTALIGTGNMNKVFVYTHTLTGWKLQAEIPSNDPNTTDFGTEVALSGDGNTALVGTWQVDGRKGAAYLLTRSGGVWSDPVKITAPDGVTNDEFASSIALSADGLTAAFGADGVSFRKGAVYVMTRPSLTGAWSQLKRFQASDGVSGQFFGNALAISADGSTILVGAVNGSNGSLDTGAAYVFTGSGGTYTEQAKWSLQNGIGYNGSRFGASVALSADGNTALIGAPFWGSGDITGFAYVYTRTGTTWARTGRFDAIDSLSLDKFGSGVALSADGTVAVVGATRASAYDTLYQGAIYIYILSDGNWVLQRKVFASDGVGGDADGEVVAISGDGHNVLFNAAYKDDGRGAVYFITDDPHYATFLPMTRK